MRYDNTKLCLFSAPGGDERTHRQLQGETDHFHHLGDKRAIGYQSVREGKKKKNCPTMNRRIAFGNHRSRAVIVE